MIRRRQLIEMRVAEDNRLASCHKSQHKSIEAVRKVINQQIAVIDGDMDDLLKKHFTEKLSLLTVKVTMSRISRGWARGCKPA